MKKIVQVIITIIITSCFFFPFGINALPQANSKMILAGVGLALFFIRMAITRKGSLSKDLLYVFLASLIFSLLVFLAVVVNSTNDFTYATYFISFAVWTGAAYTMVTTIRLVHGECTFEYIVRYLAAACVMQCILALIFQSHPELDAFFQRYTYTLGADATANIGKTMQRLHGVGAAIDIAGTRFAAVLVLIVSMLCTNIQDYKWKWFYLVSWFIILGVGSMISRTTTIGAILSIIIFILSKLLFKTPLSYRRNILTSFSCILVIVVVICTYLYQNNTNFHQNLRFGFEGFFNLVENGHWETSSSNKLQTMYVFPDNTKTWLIGDGYFEKQKYDPYYTGRNWVLFYMGTDVGYCRFIFYFGLIGLAAFICFFIVVCKSCVNGLKQYQWTFISLFLLNLIIWLKVSTDIYLVFAPFICMIAMKEQEPA